MGARGINEAMVRAAVEQLERENRPVSLKTLRAQLGCGSNTTLLRCLDRLSPLLGKRRRTPPPSPAVRAELDELMRRVWATACVDASRAEAAAVATRMAALRSQRVRLAASVVELRSEADRLLRRLDRAERELQRFARRLADGPPPAAAADPALVEARQAEG